MNNAVKGTTAVCGLLGNPVSHSVSPQIHNTLAQDLGQNLVYVPLAVADPGLLGDAVRGAFATGVTGLNVTVPYKNAVIPFLEAVDPEYGLISCGIGNKYLHPSTETVIKLKKHKVKIYRTDEAGSVILTITGDDVEFDKKQGDYKDGETIGNNQSKKGGLQ